MSKHTDQLQTAPRPSEPQAPRVRNPLVWIRENNIISLLTVAFGLVLLGLSLWEKVPDPLLNKAILGIVIMLATSELVDRVYQLNAMEQRIRKQIDERLAGVSTLTSMTLEHAFSGLEYLAVCVGRARKSVDLASLSPPITRPQDSNTLWESSLQMILVNPQVTLRYVFNKQDQARQRRVDRFKATPEAVNSFYTRLDHKDVDLPLMNFLIIDDAEVVFILPSQYGESESWVSVKSKDVIAAFQRHFDYLWIKGKVA